MNPKMKITDIEKLPRKKNKIFIDGEYAFMLYDKDLALYHIDADSEGGDGTEREISEQLYDRIMKETVLRRAHQKMLAMLERMDRTESEIRRKMKLDMYPDMAADETVEWLKQLHYLDDDRYARNYIRGHLGSASRRELSSKLFAKGISKDIFDEAYSECCDEVNFKPVRSDRMHRGITGYGATERPGVSEGSGEDHDVELDAAVRTLNKKLGTRRNLTPKERMSVIGYMMRKGFRRNEIMAAFEALDVSIGHDEVPYE